MRPYHKPALEVSGQSAVQPAMVASDNSLTMTNSLLVLSKYGKSFRFAGRFLSAEVLQDCARLYHFCRVLDDVVDETDDGALALAAIQQVRLDLTNQTSSNPVVQDFISLSLRYQFDSATVQELLNGLASDLVHAEFDSELELKRYCYRVAGVVGVFMCQIMGVDNKQALAHGIDLGIAMQMTNIARDVIEDAAAGRRYLPGDWVAGLSAQELLTPSSQKAEVAKLSIKRLLSEADSYYFSAWKGLKYLPLRNRIAIAVAAEVYRGIGVKLARRDFDIWHGRVRLGLVHKSVLAIKALLKLSRIKLQKYDDEHHCKNLHATLSGLPHTNCKPDKASH
jgi:phytoene synthase